MASRLNVPLSHVYFIEGQLDGMNLTQTDELRSYWHIQIHHDGTNWILHRRKEEEWPDIRRISFENRTRSSRVTEGPTRLPPKGTLKRSSLLVR